jgi:hypothetical protein
MPVLSPQVRYEGLNGPSPVAVQRLSLTETDKAAGRKKMRFLDVRRANELTSASGAAP